MHIQIPKISILDIVICRNYDNREEHSIEPQNGCICLDKSLRDWEQTGHKFIIRSLNSFTVYQIEFLFGNQKAKSFGERKEDVRETCWDKEKVVFR